LRSWRSLRRRRRLGGNCGAYIFEKIVEAEWRDCFPFGFCFFALNIWNCAI
jgi:hypothetical protein